MAHPFVFMGRSHLVAIALTFLVPLALVALVRKRQDARLDRIVRRTLAALIGLNWLFWMLLLYDKGWLNLGNEIPMNLCDWATAATIAALVWPGQRAFELAYFWALCGTLQALITPDCRYDFPDAQFVLFFVYHGGIVAGVLYLALARHRRPVPASFPRVIAWTFFYAAVASLVDWRLGTNYGFLRAKPADHVTLLDLLSPWPWYIAELVVIALVFMLLCYAPFYVADVLKRRAKASRLASA